MTLRYLAHHSFLLLDAGDSARRLEQLRSQVDFTHLVVAQHDRQGVLYYLVPRRILRRLHLDSDESLAQALDLTQAPPVPEVSWNLRSSDAPSICVVLDDDGEVFGFLTPELRHLGPTRSSGTGSRVSGSLRTQFQDELPLEQVASLLISLTPNVAYSFDAIRFLLPHEAEVEVVVEVEPGLERVGPREATLVFDAERETPAVQFKVRALQLGQRKVVVHAFHGGQGLGRLELVVEVTPAERGTIFRSGRHTEHHHPVMDLDGLRSRDPDADLLVLRTWENGRQGWVISLVSERLGLRCTPAPLWLQQDPMPFLRSLLRDLQELDKPTRQDLRNLGAVLAGQLLPPEIRSVLWQNRQTLRTLHIHSDENWIPWELCTLQSRNQQGRLETFGMLCERFEVTRWSSQSKATALSRWQNALLIASNDTRLEGAFQLEPAGLGLEEHLAWSTIPPRRNELIGALAKGSFQLIHYAGHASASAINPMRNALLLEENLEFTPVDLHGSAGDLGLGHPLVFLNGCRSARADLALTGDIGFAESFLNAGAAAFIGTRWDVPDDQATEFARAFYRAIVGGRTLARAMKIARWIVARKGGTTWMAYMLLAQPDAPPPLRKAKQLAYR